MKQAWMIIAVLVAFAAAAPAEEGAAPVPRIVCAAPVHDFGTVSGLDAVEHVFIVKNEGTAPLQISGHKTFCGCTVASISETNVPPGGTTEVTTKLSLAGRYGPQDKKVTVESNDPSRPSLMLSMVGTVFSPIELKPDRIAFDPLPPGGTATSEVMLVATGTNVFKVTQVRAASDPFAAELTTVEAGKQYKITIRVKLSGNEGHVNGQVSVTTDHPARPNVHIPVSAAVLTGIIVYPNEITVTPSMEGPLVRAIYLKPGTIAEFDVVSAEPPDDSMKVQVMPYVGNGKRVVISNIMPGPELVGKSVKITTTSEEMKEIVVPFNVLGLSSAQKSTAP